MSWVNLGPQKGPSNRVKSFMPHPDRFRAMEAQCGKGCNCDVSYCIIKIYKELYNVGSKSNT